MTKPFISSAVIHLNRECRLLVNFEGENGNFRFEMVNNKLYNSLQGKIKWIWISRKWFSSVQSLSRVWLFATPWIAVRQASLSITNSQSSLRLTSIESVMPSSHLILCRPLLLLPPIPPASESFPMSQLFTWGGQSTGVSALA